jgi:hypothetical protein
MRYLSKGTGITANLSINHQYCIHVHFFTTNAPFTLSTDHNILTPRPRVSTYEHECKVAGRKRIKGCFSRERGILLKTILALKDRAQRASKAIFYKSLLSIHT